MPRRLNYFSWDGIKKRYVLSRIKKTSPYEVNLKFTIRSNTTRKLHNENCGQIFLLKQSPYFNRTRSSFK